MSALCKDCKFYLPKPEPDGIELPGWCLMAGRHPIARQVRKERNAPEPKMDLANPRGDKLHGVLEVSESFGCIQFTPRERQA